MTAKAARTASAGRPPPTARGRNPEDAEETAKDCQGTRRRPAAQHAAGIARTLEGGLRRGAESEQEARGTSSLATAFLLIPFRGR